MVSRKQSYPQLTVVLAEIEFVHDTRSVVRKIPKHLTISALKGIVGILFPIKPFKISLEIALNDAAGIM